jgi:hypothetical protein
MCWFLSGSSICVIWWKTNDWGPEPGQPGCRVPPSVLAEYQQQVAA